MGPKSKKSGVLWMSCDSCGCTFSAKDATNHASSCPPPRDSWDYGFIKDCVLHATIQDIDNKGSNAKVPPDFTEKVVLLSQSAMQLCSFVIGDHIQIECGDKIAFRRAWPTLEGSLADVFIEKEILEFEWGGSLPSSQVVIHNVGRPALLSRQIHYNIKNGPPLLNHELITGILRGKTSGAILYAGMSFKIPYYGRQLHVLISQIAPMVRSTTGHQSDDLTHRLNNLNICDVDIFTTCDGTEWIPELGTEGEQNEREKKRTLEKVGGFEGIVAAVKKNIDLTLLTPHKIGKGSVCYGVLLYGVHGVGKTLLAKHLAATWEVPCIEIKGLELLGKSLGDTELKLSAAFDLAVQKCPSVITIDNIEVLCPKKGTDLERRTSSLLVGFFDMIRDKQIVVIATSAQPHDIDPAIRLPGRLEAECEIEIPSPSVRFDILNALVPNAGQLESTLRALAQATHGFVGADLASLVSKAIGISCSESRDCLTESDLSAALRLVKPSAMREVYVQVPDVHWSDIGGQEDLKLKLQQAVEWPVKYPEKFKQLGIQPPRGVLMYGPPGCSKTLAAKALANESKINFLSVKGSDIFSKWVGESERAVRDIFKRARSVAPAIVFLDELDALGGERGEGSSGQGCAVQERVLSQLLTELDGVQPLENVIILAATNRPDKIDKALLRPGRLDRLIYVPLPSLETRKKIFAYKFAKMPVDSGVDVEHLAQETAGYSGAEIVNICHDAAYNALEENLDASTVGSHNFLAALKTNRPRTPVSLLNLYKDYQTHNLVTVK